jgi:hypothetical protein
MIKIVKVISEKKNFFFFFGINIRREYIPSFFFSFIFFISNFIFILFSFLICFAFFVFLGGGRREGRNRKRKGKVGVVFPF